MGGEATDIGQLNRRMFCSGTALREFGGVEGWFDAGERAAIGLVAAQAQGPVLDIGVGGGRTMPLLRAISADYVGIDYAPAMVALARSRFPEADLREMDARHLDFPDACFGLAVFSYNGIDSIDLAGRRRVLREVRRVLRPGGYFVFSSLNRDGPALRSRWWDVARPGGGARKPERLQGVRNAARLLLRGLRYARHRRFRAGTGGFVIAPADAVNFGLVLAFIRLSEQRRQLEEAGFALEAAFDNASGEQLPPDAQSGPANHYYYVARAV